MKAEGKWAWFNQYGSQDVSLIVRRAKQVDGVIVKATLWPMFNALKAAGVRLGVERYTYPVQPLLEARLLSDGIDQGAEFAVINAEVEWEQAGVQGGTAMETLIAEFQRLQPGVELYASTDTRRGRTAYPFQKVLGQHITAWMPMIYPKAFYPGQEAGYVGRSFYDSVGSDQDFQGKPVLPTIQTYNNIGAPAVERQVEEVRSSDDLLGVSAYTMGHATDREWEAFVQADTGFEPVLPPLEPEDDREFVWWGNPNKPKYLFAERWGHYWWIISEEVRQVMISYGWPEALVTDRPPRGSRIDL